MLVSPSLEELIKNADKFVKIIDNYDIIYDTYTIYIKATPFFILKNEPNEIQRFIFYKTIMFSREMWENHNLLCQSILEKEKVNLIRQIKSYEFNSVPISVYDKDGNIIGTDYEDVNEFVIIDYCNSLSELIVSKIGDYYG